MATVHDIPPRIVGPRARRRHLRRVDQWHQRSRDAVRALGAPLPVLDELACIAAKLRELPPA